MSNAHEQRGDLYFERRLGLHLLDHRVCEGFVKLDGGQHA